MRVLLLTLGSRGDVEPFLALAVALQAAGHQPLLCASDRYRGWIEGHGVAHAAMNDGFVELLESVEGRAGLERSAGLLGMLRTVLRLARQIGPLQLQTQRDCWAAAEGFQPQLIVHHSKIVGAPDIAEQLGVPTVLLQLVPLLQPTRAFACPAFPPWLAGLGGGAMRFQAYRLINALANRFGAGPAKAWRRERGLPPRPAAMGLLTGADGRAMPLLHAHAEALLPRPEDWPASAQVCGFLRLPAQPDWQAPAALRDFLSAGPPPVYIGFGSMAGRQPEQRARQVLDAVRLAGVRALIATGWGGLRPEMLPPEVMVIEQAPHDWLFPRMAAVVHHGGAGTTAAGLIAGRPSLICPFFGDQPFWGRRVAELGLGPAPIPQKRLTAKRLAAGIREAVGNPAMREACAAMALRLRAEDGAASALRFLESVAQPTKA
jgi:sterol 3beta-glucosyltransferase